MEYLIKIPVHSSGFFRGAAKPGVPAKRGIRDVIIYILFSKSKEEYYVGQTNSVDIRLEKHNNGEVISTKHGIPWKLIATFIFEIRSAAMQLEKKIKKRGIKRYLQDKNFGV